MSKIKFILPLFCALLLCGSCSQQAFLDDLYVEPVGKFSVDKAEYEVFESVHFKNKGSGQNYVVFTGDGGHVYGAQGSKGFAANSNGDYSYSYQDPGQYTAVWIASSIKSNGDIVTSIDSAKITVSAKNGGLTSFSITRLMKLTDFGSDVFYTAIGEFITDNCINCAIPYAAWTSNVAIKRAVGISFELESDFAKLYWNDGTGEKELISNSTQKVFNFYDGTQLRPQELLVKTASGTVTPYEIAAVVIPEFTKFTINGVDATVSRNLAAYNKFNMEIVLPEGTDRHALVPSFEIMRNDVNLLSGTNSVSVKIGADIQQSGTSTVDFSAPVQYTITYVTEGLRGQKYEQSSQYIITVK